MTPEHREQLKQEIAFIIDYAWGIDPTPSPRSLDCAEKILREIEK
jgi:hypothetical protein